MKVLHKEDKKIVTPECRKCRREIEELLFQSIEENKKLVEICEYYKNIAESK